MLLLQSVKNNEKHVEGWQGLCGSPTALNVEGPWSAAPYPSPDSRSRRSNGPDPHGIWGERWDPFHQPGATRMPKFDSEVALRGLKCVCFE